ncbi:MAG: LacI family transcriptional regulator [Bifidobacteriaceae bacterium]|nr:LacI family transcriptional regulator [Bifidobacteriaceae bacterium]MCI1978643.1 LacI family transcriptional regulator [Bifidobacteriaceae bacterium]
MTSIRDIARVCGISVGTVSKALNGYKDVSKETVRKVNQVARELGYTPDSLARAMRTNTTHNLGVLFIDKQQSGLRHEYFSSVLESFKIGAERRGYDITFITGNVEGSPWRSYLAHCRYRKCDGVLIAGVDFKDQDVIDLANSEIPVVTIDYKYEGQPAVFSANQHDMGALTKYILYRGHRDIAFIHGEDTIVTEQRIAGFEGACREAGVTIPDDYIVEGLFHNPDRSFQATKELLNLGNPPTCILYPDDYSTIGGRNALQMLGLSVPEDISIAGYDGIMMSRVTSPTLTTLRQDSFAIGRKAVDKLIDTIEFPDEDNDEVVTVAGQLYRGGTVGQYQAKE